MNVTERLREAAYEARHSFAAYCSLASPFMLADHQWEYAPPIIRVEDTEGAREIVTGAPQHGKTTVTTLRGLEWILGRGVLGLNNVHSAMIAAYNESRAADLCGAVRDAFADRYSYTRLVFPEAELEEPAGKTSWRFKGRPIEEPTLSAYGVGGGTGYPTQLIIVDDYVKGIEEAMSEAYQRQTWHWWTGTMRARMQAQTRVVVTATRWLEEDLPGRLLASEEEWHYTAVPAIRHHEDGTREARWPERFPLEFLDAQAVALGARDFATLYQCDPTPASGDVWRREWFDAGRYQPGGAPELVVIATFWDTAFEKGSTADYTAWVRAGIDGSGHVWVLDAGHRRMEFPELVAAIEAGCGHGYEEAAVVEQAASGRSAIHALQAQKRSVIPIKADRDKGARARAVTPLAEAGRVHVPDTQAGELIIRECTQFPRGSHDDVHDAFVHALTYLQRSAAPIAQWVEL